MDEFDKRPAADDNDKRSAADDNGGDGSAPESAAPAGRAAHSPMPETARSAEAPEVRAAESSIIDGEEHAVDPRSMSVARLVGIPTIACIAFVPLLGVTIAWAFDRVPTWLYVPLLIGWALITACALLFGYKWPELHHRHLRYRVDDAGVRIRSGVLWRKVVSIPTSRVQHTDVSQGPVQRHHGIATLTVYTAGTEGASIALAGLEHGVAKRLRDHLLPDHEI